MSTITSVNDKGCLHLGYIPNNSNPCISQRLGAAIDHYDHFLAKFFTLLLGISVEVDINGKKRCLDKNSFKLHLQSIGLGVTYANVNLREIKNIGYNAFIANHEKEIVTRHGNLGDSLSIKKRTKLFEKMIVQLEVNNTEAVQKLILKGAYIGREFFKPNDGPISGKSFWLYRNQLESTLADHYKLTYFYSYTPLVMAIEKGNQVLTNFIMQIKGGEVSTDKKQTFRVVENTETNKKRSGIFWKTELLSQHPVMIMSGWPIMQY